MNEENLIKYYNKFNEDKRLNSKYGQIEFLTSLKYIHEYLEKMDTPKIIDIGAGSGRYSATLAEDGYDVTAVELVKHNLRMIEQKSDKVKAYQGNAVNLSRFKDETFDLVLLFGPMYHLCDKESQVKALLEAKRIAKKGAVIMVAYCMNEFAVITHGFKDNNIKECIQNGLLDDNFHCLARPDDLYNVVRLDDINELNDKAGLTRIKIITPDGPASYIRNVLNKMDDETFDLFIKYHLATCERQELIGASAHTLDILKK